MAAIEIKPEELSSFQAAHFSSAAVDHFAQHFLGPVEESYEEEVYEEGDDGLGYYPDGTKRTLTDEQIAIFRHSEIQALLRERRNIVIVNDENIDIQSSEEPADHDRIGFEVESVAEEGEVEDGEIDEDDSIIDTPTPVTSVSNSSQPPNDQKRKNKSGKKQKKIQQAREKGWFKQNVKPDLRKRTWDKTEAGLESLDYDEMENGGRSDLSRPLQRQRISYDDD